MKKILLLILLGFTSPVFSQTTTNITSTSKSTDYLSKKIEDALKAGDLKTAYHFIDDWINMGSADVRLYTLYADYLIAKGYPRKAKRKLIRAYEKFDCYSCKERADSIK